MQMEDFFFFFYTKQVCVFCLFFLGFSLNFIPHSGGPVHDVERIVTDCKYILNCYFRLVIACVVFLLFFFNVHSVFMYK